jgi:mannose-6-phosphate isomerase
MYRLTNVLRPYAWGSTTAIAELFGREPSGGPEAELWIGAHPDSPSTVRLADRDQPLDEFIKENPGATLGEPVLGLFGATLPFLTKVLAADSALSLQVHPTLEQAKSGFAAENAAGVAFNDPQRSYRDDNHKPEMIFALSDFQALCGFRPPRDAARLLSGLRPKLADAGASLDLLDEVLQLLDAGDEEAALRGAFVALLDGGDRSTGLATDTARVLAAAPAGSLGSEYAAAARLAELYPGDPGALISLLLNLVSLSPGQALCLPAGNIHAYLQGLGVEVMATSDNVLRGGLTPKYFNVPELVKITDFRPITPPFVERTTTDAGQELYCPPFAEFQLQRIELSDGGSPVPLAQHGPTIVLAVSGSVLLDSPRSDLTISRGEAAFIPAAEQPVNVHPAGGTEAGAVLFAVTTSGSTHEFDEQRTGATL